jgi:hypothetical protein
MVLQMGQGVYLLKPGVQAKRENLVDLFGFAPIDQVCSVAEQRENYEIWIKSLKWATNNGTTTLYRAVSPEEYSSVMNSGQFSFGPAGSEMKQFGFNMNEVLNYSNFASDYAAIVRAEIPTSLLGNFNVSNSIDPFIFRSGVLTINGQSGLNFLNSVVTNLGHAY